jgi:hypothetical protein
VDGPDLYVFEIGGMVEQFKVEISKDGSKWIYLYTVRGQPRSLDIHDKVAPGDRFSYVRITDANSRMSGHPWAGADIDAVGAIGAEERDCWDYCKEKFSKEGAPDRTLVSYHGDFPNCECWCKLESGEVTTDCFETKVKDETEYCKEYCIRGHENDINKEKLTGEFDYDENEEIKRDPTGNPICNCFCEEGYELREGGCKPCEDICQDMDSRAHYDDKKSKPNKCECYCKGKLLRFVWGLETGKCECVTGAEPKGDECECPEGWKPSVWGDKCVEEEKEGEEKTDIERNLRKIIDYYKFMIPWSLAGRKIQSGEMKSIGKLLSDAGVDPGIINNLLRGKWTCGEYQHHTLILLDEIRTEPERKAWMEGLDYGPIEIYWGGHQSVVIYPRGTDWRKTGIVLDPWPKGRPEHYQIEDWAERFHQLGGPRPATSGENKYLYPHLRGGPPDYRRSRYTPLKHKTKVVVRSPVDVLIVDEQGDRIGRLSDGTFVNEIPGVDFITHSLPDGTRAWYFGLLGSRHEMTLTGTGSGYFHLLTSDAEGTIQNYGSLPIAEGLKAEIILDPSNLLAPLILPDGTEVQPTILELITELPGLTFESRSKPSGSSVQIPLTLSGIEDKIGNMDITLSYDPSVLEATEVTKGDLTSDSLFEYNILAGTILISLADAEGFSGNGSIAYVTFNVIGATDSTSPLQIAALAANQAEDYEVLVIPTNDCVFKVESGLTISVSDITGAKGSTVEVPINLEGASEVGSMDIVLNYDANVLSAVDVEAGALGKNALIESNTARKGKVIIALADSSGINGAGAVASVAFEVIGDAGTTSALTLEAVLVHNLDLGEIIPTMECGTFLVT